MTLQSTIEALVAAGAGADKARARAAFDELRRRSSAATVRSAEPDPAVADRMARQHLGQAGHPARLPVRRSRRHVGAAAAVLRQGHACRCSSSGVERRRSHRARRIGDSRRRVRRPGRDLHAADVHQHRRLRRRRHAGRFARAGRIVRADRRARARQRRGADRRRARAGRRACR